MSGYDGRTKGKRFRKPTMGGSNLRERWKFLSADIEDVIDGSTPQLKKGGRKNRLVAAPANENLTRPPQAYDIDGDGQVDIREMRLAKFLDNMIAKRQQSNGDAAAGVSEAELLQMRQHAGKLLIAKEFIERNQGQLWRYGSMFAEKNEEQSAEFIAEHRKFPRVMAFLESVERKRLMRSSHHVRSVVNLDPHHEEPNDFHSQTWVESVRKVNNALTSKFPLPDLQPPPRQVHPFQPVDNNSTGDDSYQDQARDVATNEYGAIDVDGDGVVDDDEMKLHIRLKEAALDDPTSTGDRSLKSLRKRQQLEGRRMMAHDFVTRNADKMWLYSPQYKDRPKDAIIDEIATSDQFAKDFNRLRAKERVLTLKSSQGVAACIVQAPIAELPNDPQGSTEFRRVRDRTELLLARRELLRPPDQRLAALAATRGVVPGTVPAVPFGAVRQARQTLKTPMQRTRSDSVLTGLPRIFETPRRIEPTGCFSVTKWKFGDR
jgi:hypothetical protein